MCVCSMHTFIQVLTRTDRSTIVLQCSLRAPTQTPKYIPYGISFFASPIGPKTNSVLGLTDRSIPTRSSASSADLADVELVSQQTQMRAETDWMHPIQFRDAISTNGHAKERAAKEASVPQKQGSREGLHERTSRPMHGIEQVEERDLGVQPEETGSMIQKDRKSLNLSLRGSVEIQAQHRPDRLKKPRTDRLGREPSLLGPIGYAGSVQRTGMTRGKIFR